MNEPGIRDGRGTKYKPILLRVYLLVYVLGCMGARAPSQEPSQEPGYGDILVLPVYQQRYPKNISVRTHNAGIDIWIPELVVIWID